MFQQCAFHANEADLCCKTAQRKGIRIEITSTYLNFIKTLNWKLSVLLFCIIGWGTESGQLCHITGLHVVTMCFKSVSHELSRSFNKIISTVKYTAAAKAIAAGEVIDIGKIFPMQLT